MTFVNVRELKLHTGQVLDRLPKAGWAIVLSHGKPKAALVRLSEDDIEDVVFKHPAFLKELHAAQSEYRRKGGVTLGDARRKLGLSQ
jgi:antitoxin (DNA-binding transcriptional repressor) of toxin-antitoxin stability system